MLRPNGDGSSVTWSWGVRLRACYEMLTSVSREHPARAYNPIKNNGRAKEFALNRGATSAADNSCRADLPGRSFCFWGVTWRWLAIACGERSDPVGWSTA